MLLGESTFQLPTNLLCAKFGSKRSQELVALGGEDNAVHILPFADGNRIAKLEGHTTKVTAVAFDNEQKRLAAGSEGGSVRVWDLNTEQCCRTFGTGHRTTVTGIDYHSFGEFVATVSEDTHLRIWDVRKKSCLQSYKGVMNGLRTVQFSPNGKWVASGCSLGVVRLYDLTSGKLLQELVAHNAAITSMQFHPEHYFLSVGSADGSMSLWELDTFQKSFQSAAVAGRPIQRVQFAGAVDASELCVASEKSLKVYEFSSMSDRTAAVVEAPWAMCADVVYSPGGEELLAVEVKRGSVLFSRLGIGKKKQPAVALRPAVQPKPAVVRQAASPHAPVVPPVESPSRETRAPSQGMKPRQEPLVFQMNERQALALAQRVQTPPDKRAAIPMIPGGNVEPQKRPMSSSDIADDLNDAGNAMSSILQRRLTHTRVVRSMWTQDPRNALRHLTSIANSESDGGVVTDFFVAMQNQRMKERITFEILPEFLLLVVAALKHKQDPIILSSFRIARSMNTKFRTKIDEIMRGAQFMGNGVDLSLEARLEKCQELQTKFDDVVLVAMNMTARRDAVGDEAKLVINEIPLSTRRKM